MSSCPDHSIYCYADLSLSSLAVAKTIASTHCTYPARMARLSWPWVAGYTMRWFAHPKNGHPSQYQPGQTKSNFVDRDQQTGISENVLSKNGLAFPINNLVSDIAAFVLKRDVKLYQPTHI